MWEHVQGIPYTMKIYHCFTLKENSILRSDCSAKTYFIIFIAEYNTRRAFRFRMFVFTV